jgi:hypothetical protein
MATSADEAATAAEQLGFPAVMKIVSDDILHKTEYGAVELGISSVQEARAAFDALNRRVQERAPGAQIGGVLVQTMISGGRELAAGVSRDAHFGPVIMFGLGGILVEVLRDVAFRLAPIDSATAERMITRIRAASILGEVRGQPAVDTTRLADTLVRLGALASDHPAVMEIDINPLLASDSGVIAADARVLIAIPHLPES